VRNAGIENLMAALEDEKFRTPSAELSDVKLSGSNHEKIDQILKDVVVFVDHEDKRTDFLDKIFYILF
jgi:ferrous iron transport protein B